QFLRDPPAPWSQTLLARRPGRRSNPRRAAAPSPSGPPSPRVRESSRSGSNDRPRVRPGARAAVPPPGPGSAGADGFTMHPPTPPATADAAPAPPPAAPGSGLAARPRTGVFAAAIGAAALAIFLSLAGLLRSIERSVVPAGGLAGQLDPHGRPLPVAGVQRAV